MTPEQTEQRRLLNVAQRWAMPWVETVLGDPAGKYLPRGAREGLAVRSTLATLLTVGIALPVPEIGAQAPEIAAHLRPDVAELARFWHRRADI